MLRVGDVPTSGWGRLRFLRGVYDSAGHEGVVPVAIERDGAQRWTRRGHIDEVEAASLDALGASLILPVHREQDLSALICLGEKQSGDIFTANELALLEGIADRAGLALLRFDERDAEAEAREKQRALRRYVPEALVSQLERGGEIAPGEREVTVLFIDLRDYTSLARRGRATRSRGPGPAGRSPRRNRHRHRRGLRRQH